MASLRAVYVLSNGPGELLTWVKPILPALSKWFDVYLFILPCQFASGREYEVALSWKELRGVYSPSETWKYLLFGGKRDVAAVLQFGGDTFYGRWFKKKLKTVYILYTMATKVFRGVDYILTPYEVLRKRFVSVGVGEDRVFALGNPALLNLNRVDNRQAREVLGLGGGVVVGFLPGSRVKMFPESFDAMLEYATFLREKLHIEALFLISQFIREREISSWYEKHECGWLHLVKEEKKEFFFGASDVVVVPPGSNNIEAAYLNGRGIVVLPLEFLRYLSVGGVLHLFLKLPFVGDALRKMAFERYMKENRYLSWLNRINNGCVFKEVVGYNIKGKIVDEVRRLLSSDGELQVKTDLFRVFDLDAFRDFLERVLV